VKVNVDKTLVASIALHVLVIGWGLFTFSSKAFAPAEESLPIDIISSDQLAKIMAGQKTGDKDKPKPKVEKVAEAKPEEDAVGKVTEKKELIKTSSTPEPPPKPVEKPVEKKPDPPKPVAEAKPKEEPKPQEKKPDPAKEDPLAELQKKLDTKKPPPKPQEQKVAAVQPQPKPKERSFDPAQIQRDLDKRAATRHELAGSTLNASASLGSQTGTANNNIATWRGAFMTAVRRCFTPPYDGQDRDLYAADIDILMKSDGTLASEPIIVEVRGPSRSIAQAIAESAKRAIVQCQVYSFLPKQQYENWKKIETTFDLKDNL
jgi:colicin import membrane protein